MEKAAAHLYMLQPIEVHSPAGQGVGRFVEGDSLVLLGETETVGRLAQQLWEQWLRG